MVQFNDRRGAADRVRGFIRDIGAAYHEHLLRQIITPFNPNAPHPLDNPDNPLSKSLRQDPYEPSDVQKMYGMNRNDVKKMHKKYDMSTGIPITKKDMKRAKKSPWF